MAAPSMVMAAGPLTFAPVTAGPAIIDKSVACTSDMQAT